MADNVPKKFIQSAIKRPGALTARANKNKQTVIAQANQDMKSGTPLDKKQASFFLNVLRKVGGKRRAKKRSLLDAAKS